MEELQVDVVVVGGGEAGLAVGYHLRRSGLSFTILDAENGSGGAWRHAWQSLRLFSPAAWSSLPGWQLAGNDQDYPSRDDILDYLARYEARYELPVRRPVMVRAVERTDGDRLRIVSDQGAWMARMVVSTTGTWRHPVMPAYPARRRSAALSCTPAPTAAQMAVAAPEFALCAPSYARL